MGIMDTFFGSPAEQSQTTQSNGQNWAASAPWEFQAPYLGQGYATAQDLFQNGGSTVTPFSQQTELGMGMVQNRALTGSDTLNSANQFNTALTSGWLTPDASAGFAGLNSLASSPSFMNVAAPVFDINQFGATGGAGGGAVGIGTGGGGLGTFRDVEFGNDHLNQVQGGYYLDNQNPYLSDMYNAATNDVTRAFTNTVTPTLNATFGMGGRTGSGIHAQSLGDANYNLAGQLGDVAANMYGQAYQFERGQQDTAANALMGNRFNAQSANQNADLSKMGMNKDIRINSANNSNSMGIAKLGAGVDMARLGLDASMANQNAYSDALARQLSSSSEIANNYFQGLGQQLSAAQGAPALAEADYLDASKMLGLGNMVDAKAGEYANQPYDMLEWYMKMIGAPVVTNDAYSYDTSQGQSSATGGDGGLVGDITDGANLWSAASGAFKK